VNVKNWERKHNWISILDLWIWS